MKGILLYAESQFAASLSIRSFTKRLTAHVWLLANTFPIISLRVFFWQVEPSNSWDTPPALEPMNTMVWDTANLVMDETRACQSSVIKIKLQESVFDSSLLPPIFDPLGTRVQSYTYNLPSLNLYFQRWGASWKEKSPKEWRRRENGPNDLQTRKQIPEQREWTLMLFQKVWQ